jgi:hypothetical protein
MLSGPDVGQILAPDLIRWVGGNARNSKFGISVGLRCLSTPMCDATTPCKAQRAFKKVIIIAAKAQTSGIRHQASGIRHQASGKEQLQAAFWIAVKKSDVESINESFTRNIARYLQCCAVSIRLDRVPEIAAGFSTTIFTLTTLIRRVRAYVLLSVIR